MEKQKNHNYTKKVGGNTIVQFIGKIITTAISLFLVAALTRYLGVNGYGEYTTIFTYVSFAAIVADFGFFWVLVRELSKPNTNQEKIFNNVISLKIIFSIVVFFISALIAQFIPQYSENIRMGIVVISVAWFWMSLNSTYVGLFQSKLEMYKAVITDVIGRIIILGGTILLIKNGLSLSSILWVYVLGNTVNFILSLILGSKHLKFSPEYDKSLWKMILRESLPLAMLSLVGMVDFKIDTIMLSVMKSSEDVGIYGVPYKIIEIVILIPGIFMGNVFPVITKYYYDKDPRLNSVLQRSYDFMILIGIPVVVGLAMLSTPIIRFIAGPEYVSASQVTVMGYHIAAPQILTILSISILVTFMQAIYPSILTIIGKQNKQVLPMIIITSINIVLNLIFIPFLSYFASAIATIISEFLRLIWWKKLVHKYLPFKLNYIIFFKSVLASAVMGVVLYVFRQQNLFVLIGLGAFIYILIAYYLKAIDINAIKSIISKNKSITIPENNE